MSKPLTYDVFKAELEKQHAMLLEKSELHEKMDDFKTEIDRSMDRLGRKMKGVEEHFTSSAREILAHKQASDDRILAAIEDLMVLRSRCMGLLLLTVATLAGGLWRAGLL